MTTTAIQQILIITLATVVMLTMRKEIDTVASIEKLGGPSGNGAGSGEDNLVVKVS